MGTLSSPVPQPGEQRDPAPQVLSGIHIFFETSLYLLLLTSVLTVLSTGKLDPISSAVALIGVLVKGWRGRRGHPPELSESLAKRLTIAYLVFLPIDTFYLSMGLTDGSQNQSLFAALLAVVHLLLFTLLVRLYSARTTRDHLFLAMVAFGLVLVSAILTIDTAFLGFLIVFLLLCISTFMGLELRRSAEGAASPPLASGTAAARRLHRALGLTTASLSLGAVLGGGVIFLLLPRITAGFLSNYNFQPNLLAGFSDADTQLGQIGSIKLNPAVVMRVKPLVGEIGLEYWRGNAFTSFDGSRWFIPPHQTQIADRDESNPTAWYTVWWEPQDLVPFDRDRYRKMLDRRAALNAIPRTIAYRVFLEPIGTDKIFMATQGMAVRGTFTPGAERLNQRHGGFLNVDVTGSVSNPAQNFSRLVYEARSLKRVFPAALLREAGSDLTPDIQRWYLQLPDLDPRIPQLARQITANAPTAYDKVIAIDRYLRTNYIYSLETTGASLAGFLFDKKQGHCEYFATALAVLLRTVGVPTRYARGFYGGEYNDVGGDWILRARDAHSWVEVYFPDVGWVTFDPTPPAPTGLRGLLHRLAMYWDAAELMWIDWVVNYNFRQQNALASNLNRGSARWSRQLYDWAHAKYAGAVLDIGQLRRGLIRITREAPLSTAAVLLGVTAVMLYLWKRRALLEWLALRGVRLGKKEEIQLVTLYYQQMLHALARRGLQRAPGQTPREFLATVAAAPHMASLAQPVGTLTAIFEAARYGSASPDFQRLAAMLQAIRAAPRAH